MRLKVNMWRVGVVTWQYSTIDWLVFTPHHLPTIKGNFYIISITNNYNLSAFKCLNYVIPTSKMCNLRVSSVVNDSNKIIHCIYGALLTILKNVLQNQRQLKQ